ncbi:GtrA family protein [Paragemmobacter straminiformis]|uniref:GtrA family protein n=1 Tax=Paragemmobacter straminiformis TaxID=2045119 RepID=A0A842I9J8_9RHOB|nr:GtrA family protein [Gemmobacter straminiformis]MBC2836289.1 GtrA family protein [Gemmobacter straminiformis]
MSEVPTPLRFVLTGLLVNGTLFLVLALLLRWRVDYRLAVTVTYLLGMAWGYLQNRLWSWRSKAPVVQSVSRYLVVYGGVYLAHMGIVALLVERAGLGPLGAAAVSAVIVIGPLFALLDRAVFPKETRL